MEREEAYQIGKQILHEHDLEFTVNYKGDTFYCRYPEPYNVAAIEVEIASRLGGMPRSSYAPDHVAIVTATAYTHAIVDYKKSPRWFTSAWKCYDENLLIEIYNGYLRFREEFRKSLSESRFEGSGEGSSG